MAETKYTEEHEWISVEGDVGTIGITQYAQEQLGDVVFVELPDPGREVEDGEAISVVDSVKAASDVYAPLAGRITEINQAIIDDPALVNRDSAGEGWFFKLALADTAAFDALLDEDAYNAFLETL